MNPRPTVYKTVALPAELSWRDEPPDNQIRPRDERQQEQIAYGKGHTTGAAGSGEKGAPVGRTNVTQVSFGFTFGAQAYSEILFFRDQAVLDNFRAGNTEFSAQASAVIAHSGAAAKTSYNNDGVAVFVHVKGGAMVEASLGGQQFKYQSGLGD